MGSNRIAAAAAAGVCTFAAAASAHAGALLLPGVGPTSTARAGAWVADADDPTALAINPAGLSKQWGTVLYVGSNFLQYSLEFSRRGTYDPIPDYPMGQPQPSWIGQPYPTMKDKSKPPIGIGPFQALPLIAVSTDLGLHVRGLRFGAGVYVPNSFPTRDMGKDYVIDDPNRPPPPTRYDVLSQEAAIIFPSVAVAYHFPNDKIDVGLRFSPANASIDAVSYTWGQPDPEEWTGKDSVFHLKASDPFIPVFQLGVLVRPSPSLELGAAVQTETDVHAKGEGTAVASEHLAIAGQPVIITPPPEGAKPLCAAGGAVGALKACIDIGLPLIATAGARFIVRDDDGRAKADIELDGEYERWSAVSDYTVIVDGYVLQSIALNPTVIKHGLKDTFSARLGGSVHPNDKVTVRGGIAFDTKAAKAAWERADLDGAQHLTFTAGGSLLVTPKVRLDLGAGYVYEGTRTQGSDCNVLSGQTGCVGDGSSTPVDARTQPDPLLPLTSVKNQNENPINSGTFKSSYILFMLAANVQF
jgi:long-chain fatty acid transport protein